MPLYSYLCDGCGVEQDELFRFSNRPKVVECRECGGYAKYVIRLSMAQANDAGNGASYDSEGCGLVIHDYRCKSCEHVFDEIIDRRAGETHTDSQECPKCKAVDSKWLPSVKIDRWSERFPYYDRGLGVMLKNKAHRREICKQRGITPVDGDWDIDSEYRKMDDINEKEEREYAKYCDQVDNSPDFREVRKLRDQGRI